MREFATAFFETFVSGGWLMAPIALLAFYLYFSAFRICFRLRGFLKICSDDALFARAYADFERDFYGTSVSGSEGDYRSRIVSCYSLLRDNLAGGALRTIKTLKLLAGVEPLLGLLGTVAGISESVAASNGNGAEGVSGGISLALITTQAGLVAAIPAWLLTMTAAFYAQRLLEVLSIRERAAIGERGGQ